MLECHALTMVVRHVPAEVCENCGEEYVDQAAAAAAWERAETAARDGVTVEVREYAAPVAASRPIGRPRVAGAASRALEGEARPGPSPIVPLSPRPCR